MEGDPNDFLTALKAELSVEDQSKFKQHRSSPFCWLEHSDGTKTGLGGRDNLTERALAKFPDDAALKALSGPPGLMALFGWSRQPDGTAQTAAPPLSTTEK